MRTVTYGAACSLDGFIADPDGTIDWLHFSDDVRHPILLGSGIPLFRDAGRRIPLRLLECRAIDGGCIMATYKVVG